MFLNNLQRWKLERETDRQRFLKLKGKDIREYSSQWVDCSLAPYSQMKEWLIAGQNLALCSHHSFGDPTSGPGRECCVLSSWYLRFIYSLKHLHPTIPCGSIWQCVLYGFRMPQCTHTVPKLGFYCIYWMGLPSPQTSTGTNLVYSKRIISPLLYTTQVHS